MADSQRFEYELNMVKLDDYKFIVDFNEDSIADLLMDESEDVPGGKGKGPTASMLLAASIGNCLSASLYFCLTKKKNKVNELKTKVIIFRERNKEGFWKISVANVIITPDIENAEDSSVQQCIEIFRKYCVVSSSIEEGIKINVTIDK
ncbi:MAG: OsmC family protein [Candidatus Heimdallarchaeota archaeon]|nr:OsmC family protein [Candidatus Heimdallarchaeota archaeon]